MLYRHCSFREREIKESDNERGLSRKPSVSVSCVIVRERVSERERKKEKERKGEGGDVLGSRITASSSADCHFQTAHCFLHTHRERSPPL